MLGPSRRVARHTARRNVGVAPVAAAAVVAAPTAGRRVAPADLPPRRPPPLLTD